jgi:DNA-binding XRE family transcriptional regulator
MRKSVYTAEYTALRAQLRTSRAQAGLSQRQLAALLKVPHSWVAKVESGERRIDVIECAWFLVSCGANPISVLKRVMRSFSLSAPRRSIKGGG